MSNRFRFRSTIRCNYISYNDPITRHTYRLPMLHVRLIHGQKALKSVALIDSGATTNFIPRELAELLELDLSKTPKDAVGAGGAFSNIESRIDRCVLVKGINSIYEEFDNLFTFVPVQAGTLPYMILGRESIFRRFDIKFQEREEKVILKRHGS